MKDITTLDIKLYLDGCRKGAEERHATWRGVFASSSIRALEWVDQVFDDAATIELAATTLHAIGYFEGQPELNDEGVVANVREVTQRELIRLATQNTNRSTGQGQNLLDYARVQAYAKFSLWLNGNY
jgi:hypothetical protein